MPPRTSHLAAAVLLLLSAEACVSGQADSASYEPGASEPTHAMGRTTAEAGVEPAAEPVDVQVPDLAIPLRRARERDAGWDASTIPAVEPEPSASPEPSPAEPSPAEPSPPEPGTPEPSTTEPATSGVVQDAGTTDGTDAATAGEPSRDPLPDAGAASDPRIDASAGPGDAGANPRDAAVADAGDAALSCDEECALAGGVCVEEACVFDCSASGACPFAINCPAARDCVVACGEGSCSEPVECPKEASCQVDCDGDGSCTSGVTCRGDSCDIGCHGQQSCQGRIGGGATVVTIVCDAPQSCSDEVACDAENCELQCSAGGTCGSLRASATQVNATCSGSNSCTSVVCNASECALSCGGFSSCDSVQCNAGVTSKDCN